MSTSKSTTQEIHEDLREYVCVPIKLYVQNQQWAIVVVFFFFLIIGSNIGFRSSVCVVTGIF